MRDEIFKSRCLFFKKILFVILVLIYFYVTQIVYAATTYNFEADTIGNTPSGVAVTAGTFDVQDEVTLGKSMRAITQVGVIAGVIFDDFVGSADHSVVWKQAYSGTSGRGGFTLRAQDTDTNTVNSVGAKQGYLFQVYDSNSVYIWRVSLSGYTALWSGSLTKAQPRWFKAEIIGSQLTFSYSNNGTDYTQLASVSDSVYTTGKVQYTAGYGSAVNLDYVDDIVITNLDADVVSPTISTLSPVDNTTDVSVTTNLTITFDENVDVETGNIKIYKTLDNSLVESIDVTSGQVTGTGTNIITIDPSVTLSSGTEYYIQIDATAFDDTNGNSFAGISDTTTWSFTTVVIEDPYVAQVVVHANGMIFSGPVSALPGYVVPRQQIIYPDGKVVYLDEQITDGVVTNISVPQTNNYFTRTLKLGMSGEDVRILQLFLNKQGFTLASDGMGSPGNETNYFGYRTYNALIKFQEVYASDILLPIRLTKGTGVFAELSQKKVQEISQ